MTEQVHHPIFARLYEGIASTADRRGADEHRRKLLNGLVGRVIEVGAGNGANLPYYPASVEQVVAVEPEGYLRQQAEQTATLAPVPITIVEGLAEELPGEDGSFDAGVGVFGGCHPTRNTAAAIVRAGFVIERCEHFPFSPAPLVTLPYILGVARRPS